MQAPPEEAKVPAAQAPAAAPEPLVREASLPRGLTLELMQAQLHLTDLQVRKMECLMQTFNREHQAQGASQQQLVFLQRQVFSVLDKRQAARLTKLMAPAPCGPGCQHHPAAR